ncbi:MAG: ABC transporter ATP-binding protein, partial [Nanoarchaeota archaeon]|nr:ABC transporter ATP-binding protein [Nanoarchaeota archaeon]
VLEFYEQLKEQLVKLDMHEDFALRYLNEGFSGGEKKRMEMLQLSILKPKYAILDEIDSGTDVGAMKLIAEQLKQLVKKENIGLILVSHYQKFLHYLKPDRVYIIKEGTIIKEGDATLIDEIEKKGFDNL